MNGTGFEISVDHDRDMVIVRYTGVLSLDLAKRALDAATGEPGNSASTLVLLDTTDALVHEIDVEWLRAYQDYKASRCYPSQITALVVSRDESHQLLGQLWAAIRATTTLRSPGVFTDEAAAIEWLLEQREAGGARTMTA